MDLTTVTTDIAGEPVIRVAGISKSYGGTHALRNVSVEIAAGHVHALVGENGAGKSTLGKIMGGVIRPDAGELSVNGASVRYGSPRDALQDGVAVILQELALVPELTAAENVFLGIEPQRRSFIRKPELLRAYDDLVAQAGLNVRAGQLVGTMRVAEQQKVEILRAIARRARVIVMDEPTSALTADEIMTLHDIVRGLRADGTTIIYVSHYLEEVLSLADVVTVLRNGELVKTSPAASESPATLVAAMVGRGVDTTFPDRAQVSGELAPLLEVRGLTRRGVLHDISLDIRPGEIVGLAGLVGSGRTELGRALFGADKRQGGTITLSGQSLRFRRPGDAIKEGVAMVPESRKEQGLILDLPIATNVTLPHLPKLFASRIVRPRVEGGRVRKVLDRLDVRPPQPEAIVGRLSGGNQQKVLFAKWLISPPQFAILDEPTRGVDVGARRAIHDIIVSLAADGTAVLLISSDIEEVMGLSHRILVMRSGRLVAQFDGADANQGDVMRAAFGITDATEGPVMLGV